MKSCVMACALSLIASTALASSSISKDEVKRLNDATIIVNELRDSPDKGVPEELWSKAECVVVVPGMKKAAFVVGGEYGAGVMSCRAKNGWSAPIFMQLAKGSWGLQIGAEEVDLVLLVMNRRGIDKLLQDKVSLGADASVAAGPVGRHGSAATDAQLAAEMLAYSRTRGVFAGIDLSGGVLKPDKDRNEKAYGDTVNPRDIARGASHPTPPIEAKAFLRALRTETRATTGRK
jgi:SH3 domain-containing YSC84-like protein 1